MEPGRWARLHSTSPSPPPLLLKIVHFRKNIFFNFFWKILRKELDIVNIICYIAGGYRCGIILLASFSQSLGICGVRRLILFVFCLFYMLSAFSQEGEEIDSPMVSSALVTEKESINPVIVTAHSAQNLQWDSTGSVFSYQEDDTVVLRSSQFPFLHFANIELEGVQDYSLYHEVDSGIQLIAGASDGTVAVWSVPISPPPLQTIQLS